MINKTFTIITILFSFFMNVTGQTNESCYTNEMKGFIKDGQDYTLTLEDSKTGKIYLSFFEGFQYRVIICSKNIRNFKIALYDIEKNLLFSGSCENYVKDIDLKFKSNIACFAEVTIDKIPDYKPVFSIAIGFKEDQSNK